jgi:hypothetical protein
MANLNATCDCLRRRCGDMEAEIRGGQSSAVVAPCEGSGQAAHARRVCWHGQCRGYALNAASDLLGRAPLVATAVPGTGVCVAASLTWLVGARWQASSWLIMPGDVQWRGPPVGVGDSARTEPGRPCPRFSLREPPCGIEGIRRISAATAEESPGERAGRYRKELGE